MKRYSIASSSSRRKSGREGPNDSAAQSSTLELERLEQEITLTLQEIDKNLSKANAIINDKMFPILKSYSKSSSKVWSNVNFWKYFMEKAANVELTGYEEPIRTNAPGDANTNRSHEAEILGAAGAGALAGGMPASSGAFKKPPFKLVEETPTWSEDVRNQPGRIHSSTPQTNRPGLGLGLGMRTGGSGAGTGVIGATRFDSTTDSVRIPPPPSPKMVHTIRQSLDRYHRVSISPRKTPVREDGNKRSSVIQNLIDSSPTLPQPPILLSEMAANSPAVLEGAAPSVAVSKSSPRKRTSSSRDSLQRFPLTPKYSSQSNTPRHRRRSGGSQPPSLPPPQQHSAAERAVERDEGEENLTTNEEIPVPELETIDLLKKRKPSEFRDGDDDEDNVFLDRSATTTVYHSVVVSKENTNISNLFQEVLDSHEVEGHKPTDGGGEAKDLFGDILPREEDLTGNSTGDMGSFLGERFRKITRNG